MIKDIIQKNLLSILKEDSKQEKREYLGASLAGSDCNRYIWLKFRYALKEKFNEKYARVFRRGNAFEKEFISKIPKIFDAWDYQVEFQDGWIKGHADAMVKIKDKDYLIEIKTANQSNFLKFQKDGLVKTSPKYYIQIQIYLHKFQINECIFYVLNKNTDEDYIEIIEYNKEIAEAQMSKLRMIVDSESPMKKINENPDFFACKMCEMHGICHKKEPVNITCRTCKNFEFKDNGKYFCKWKNKLIPSVLVMTDQEGDKSCPKYDMIDGISENKEQLHIVDIVKKFEDSFGEVQVLRRV